MDWVHSYGNNNEMKFLKDAERIHYLSCPGKMNSLFPGEFPYSNVILFPAKMKLYRWCKYLLFNMGSIYIAPC